MRPIQSLIFILSLALFSCKQSNPTKQLVTDDLKYSAYYWHLNEHTDSFEFYLVHYINIDKEGNYFLMRHDVWRDKPRYFKGSINDTIRKCIDTTFLKDNFKTDYTYMTNPNFIYDGFTYCLDYKTQHEKRKEILFISPNSPNEIKTISTLLDTLIYSNQSEIIDTLNLDLYTKQLKELAEKVAPPPLKMVLPPPLSSKTIFALPCCLWAMKTPAHGWGRATAVLSPTNSNSE
jgi:hypothetical protein